MESSGVRLFDDIIVRTTGKPGDLGAVVSLHGIHHGAECGFDSTFEAYVAGPLAAFVINNSPRERLWIAESEGCVVGSCAIVAATATTAQLRWFLIDPRLRGRGLGRQFLTEAIAFAKENGYTTVILWTVSALTKAARLYHAAGFRKVEEKPGRMWGVDVIEEKYELNWS